MACQIMSDHKVLHQFWISELGTLTCWVLRNAQWALVIFRRTLCGGKNHHEPFSWSKHMVKIDSWNERYESMHNYVADVPVCLITKLWQTPFIQCIFVSIMFHLLLISLEEACTDPSFTFIASGCLYIGIVQTESDGLIHRLPGPMPGSQDFRFQTLHSSFLPVV